MSDALYVGTRKGLFVFRQSRGGWQQQGLHFLGEPVSMMLFDERDATLHAALNLGHFGVKMRRSRDGGKSWQETAVPAYPPQPENTAEEKSWTLAQVWALENGGGDRPGVLWAGTNPGGLFISRDGGDSWEIVRSLWDRPERQQWMGGGYDSPGIHSICVDPRNSDHVTVAVSCGGVWQTRDAGVSWSLRASGMLADYMPPEQRGDPNIQDPHRVVQCAAQADSLWAQHHCGIWRSRDNAASWQQVFAQPSSFGFAVAVHPRDAETAWFAPAIKDAQRIPVDGNFVVTRTRDGGKTFDVLQQGLPIAPAYDLIYRHSLVVDDSGQRLAMGSTTGGLWLSENAGDTWNCVSAHLPPIYCLRFA